VGKLNELKYQIKKVKKN